jgi:tRNA threonylcarbamoyladenosine biosynthesis protein TsaB
VKLLALDTSTELCSAALWLDGAVSYREATRERGHSELILPMIDELLRAATLALRQLDAIAFGRGPGAFTGVRLGAGVAQGLGFAAGLPLLPISDLRALAAQALLLAGAPSRAVVCQDARMEQCYWGCFEQVGDTVHAVTTEAVAAPSRVALPPAWWGQRACGAGSGFAAYPRQLEPVAGQLTVVFAEFRPRACEVALLAAQDGLASAVPAEQAQPVYLRDDVASSPAVVPAPPSPD